MASSWQTFPENCVSQSITQALDPDKLGSSKQLLAHILEPRNVQPFLDGTLRQIFKCYQKTVLHIQSRRPWTLTSWAPRSSCLGTSWRP